MEASDLSHGFDHFVISWNLVILLLSARLLFEWKLDLNLRSSHWDLMCCRSALYINKEHCSRIVKMQLPSWICPIKQICACMNSNFDQALSFLLLFSRWPLLSSGVPYRLHHGHEAAGLGSARPGRLLRALGPLETRVGEGRPSPCQSGSHTRACGQVGCTPDSQQTHKQPFTSWKCFVKWIQTACSDFFLLLICLFLIDAPEQTVLDLEKVNIIGTFFGGGDDVKRCWTISSCKLEKQT